MAFTSCGNDAADCEAPFSVHRRIDWWSHMQVGPGRHDDDQAVKDLSYEWTAAAIQQMTSVSETAGSLTSDECLTTDTEIATQAQAASLMLTRTQSVHLQPMS